MTTRGSISARFPGEARLLRLLLLFAALSLGVGLFAPVVTLEKFLVVENTFSVVSGVMQLLEQGKWLLFIVITGFSVLLPLLKLGVLHALLSRRDMNETRLRRYLHWMHEYGRWSMLDVFVVAVLVVAVKLGAIASVEMRYGLYAFVVAVLLTMVITARVVRLSAVLDDEAGDLSG